ncbi:hypothetical protein L2E82_44242 [Cichorium intybus]|uniref:Uncharacterized protein n=1 Tax=Cichorium intybus TaxID=13427 RepID=A0ACB8ZR05_CICIN|nr:hypothetical protein L2E82_44242 [Cichorium intybus]
MEMRKLILVWVTLVCCLGGIVEGFTYDDKEVETEEGKSVMFERWRSHHKMESISAEDKMKQYKNFKHNLEIVHSTNKANKPYKLEMNRFAGMHFAEFKSKYTGFKAAAPPKIKPGKKYVTREEWPWDFKYRNVNASDIPPSIDWRANGAVTPATDQGDCGSCYAFAVVATVESLYAIRTKQLIALSPKEILDCCNCGGCDGGRTHDAMMYIVQNNGLTTEKNYPYKPVFETCSVKKENDVAVKIRGYEQVPFNHEQSLMAAVANQPIEVSIECEEPFMLYKGGVMTAPCGTSTSHSVAAVGYGTEPDGTQFWILKNSWGPEYGEKGFLRILRGVPEKEGYCGINTGPHFPVTEECSREHAAGGDPVVHMSRDL